MEEPAIQSPSRLSSEHKHPEVEETHKDIQKPLEGENADPHMFNKPRRPSERVPPESKPSTSNIEVVPSKSVEEESYCNPEGAEDKDYESEPASLEKAESRRKAKNRTFKGSQGRTMYPRTRSTSKEMRELSRKHALLEKNLKIEGLPEPPKFRKRRLSLSNMGRTHDKDVPYKRKRLTSVDNRPKRDHMPKWELMGGDANDPLNLNGLAHSEEGRLLNLKTPETSPLPTPDFRKIVYIKVPPNIEDPLNLEGKHDQKVLDKLLRTTIKKRHRSKKKKHDDTQPVVAAESSASATAVPSHADDKIDAMSSQPETQTDNKLDGDTLDSESLTPTKSTGRRSRSRSLSTSPERKLRRQLSGNKGRMNQPTKFPENPKFTLGNYNRYYGYRNRDHEPDPRLQYFDPSWFKGKDVLDIGCNVGHITLSIAEHFYPHKILGMDIDGKLIQSARQNIRHMLSQRRKDSAKYPRVLEMTRGPLEAHPLMGSSDNFPNNVLFLQGNYVPGSEEILKLQKEEYDTILALSITKWIHLNNGDDGLKLFFQKIFRQLRPGGRLILEPQPWSTYRKRAKLSPELFARYQTIKLKPEGFKHYLLSIGFVKCEVIGVPVTKAKGFRRPLILFTKADNKQTPSILTNEEFDVRDVCQECGNLDKSQCEHPQFTGMRCGPYASHMYDHIGYPCNSSSESPYLSSSFRTNPNCNYSFIVPNVEDSGLNSVEVDGVSSCGNRRHETAGELGDNSVMMHPDDSVHWGNNLSSGSSGSSTGSQSQSATSSSSSGSGHSSERSCSSTGPSGSGSTHTSSSSYYSPNHNGPNGDIANVVYSPSPQEGGNIASNMHSPNLSGPNGDIIHDLNSPNHIEQDGGIVGVNFHPLHEGPNGDIADDVLWDDNTDNSGGAAAAAAEDTGSGEFNDDLVEPVHGNNSMNGDHEINVIQWDDDNDANIDAPVAGPPVQDWMADNSGAAGDDIGL